MKICRIVEKFPTGKEILGDLGPNYYYYAKGTTAKGFEEHIICKRKPNQPEKEKIEGINIWRVSPDVPRSRKDQREGEFAKKSLAMVKKIKPEIVHGHNTYHYYITKHKKELNKQGTRIITHYHGDFDKFKFCDHLPFSFNLKAALIERLLDWSIFFEFLEVTKNSDFIITCDKFTKNSVEKYSKNIPIEVVYNGVDLKKFKRVKTDIKEKYDAEFLLMDIARPVPWKGIQYLIEASKKLEEEFKGLKCIVLGVKREGYNVYFEWLKSIREKLNAENVELLGNVPYFELPAYYSATDCFVTPAHPDPSPKTVYEAQACNTPISASNSGGIPEIFGKKSGLLFEPRKIDDIIEKTRFILEHPKKFKGGREIIKGKATWTVCVKKIVKAYEKWL